MSCLTSTVYCAECKTRHQARTDFKGVNIPWPSPFPTEDVVQGAILATNGRPIGNVFLCKPCSKTLMEKWEIGPEGGVT